MTEEVQIVLIQEMTDYHTVDYTTSWLAFLVCYKVSKLDKTKT